MKAFVHLKTKKIPPTLNNCRAIADQTHKNTFTQDPATFTKYKRLLVFSYCKNVDLTQTLFDKWTITQFVTHFRNKYKYGLH